ncbi:magnesium-translocating P-type ATPase [Candidatus Kuenenbacteria bacterium]|nr:magnesium-translocating P-type ATPase [Candidatus Kuenenbacteria bacterium]
MNDSKINNQIFFSSQPIDNVFKILQTSKNGLSKKEAMFRLKRDGRNVISEKKEISVILEFFSHFKSPLIIILLIAAFISACLGEIKNFAVIAFMVLASVILDFFEEHSANDAAKKLKEKVSVTATVIRDGEKKEIKTSELCIGDIIFLNSGDLAPADARIFMADDLFIDESTLTGEPFPQEKFSIIDAETDSNNSKNLIWLGTNVISGTALAVVFQTGQATKFGAIAKSILKKDEKSEFELGITKFGFFISKVILVLVLIIFFGNAMVNKDILGSFIFAVAIAVGVTPELLPMIMSIAMARGSRKMAKHGVIVKKLSSIPNFGSMNILCADKTGTITENNIQLVKYTDIFGSDNENVFLYTYLNSFHQTGVNNPLDKAVLNFKKIAIESYYKVEEIPFDFIRRMMSIAVVGPEGRTLITKGAPETVIKRCNNYYKDGKIATLTTEIQNISIDNYKKISSDGYRVLAVAIKKNLQNKNKYTIADETDLILIGFVSFLDPAKKDATDILRLLQLNGIEVKVITGDNELVTQKICKEVGLENKGILLGSDIDALTDDALGLRSEQTTIFARFSPNNKNRVINALRKQGNVVGYLGDGINDAPSLKAADIGISVNNAVDIAKESADIILTDKGLKLIINGVLEGRRSFGNTMKYLMMGLSSNFGNMFSVIFALFYLPFLPMLPIQILLNNFIYDSSQITIPMDKVDSDWLQKPRKWNMFFIKKFMLVFGPISSIFDIITFVILFSVFKLNATAFQTGWFLESLATQTLVIHIIRTKHIPFLQSRANKFLTLSTFGAVAIGWIIPFTKLGQIFNFSPLPLYILFVIAGEVLVYLIIIEFVKRIYYKKYEL